MRAWAVTAPCGPRRQAAALAIHEATGILIMGGGPSWVRRVSNRIQGVHPPALSRGSRQQRLNCQVAFTIMFSGIWDGAETGTGNFRKSFSTIDILHHPPWNFGLDQKTPSARQLVRDERG